MKKPRRRFGQWYIIEIVKEKLDEKTSEQIELKKKQREAAKAQKRQYGEDVRSGRRKPTPAVRLPYRGYELEKKGR